MFKANGVCMAFAQYCDFSRQYDPDSSPATLGDGTVIPPWNRPGVDTFIDEFGRKDLLTFSMQIHRDVSDDRLKHLAVNQYWINQGAPNNVFWAHEVSPPSLTVPSSS